MKFTLTTCLPHLCVRVMLCRSKLFYFVYLWSLTCQHLCGSASYKKNHEMIHIRKPNLVGSLTLYQPIPNIKPCAAWPNKGRGLFRHAVRQEVAGTCDHRGPFLNYISSIETYVSTPTAVECSSVSDLWHSQWLKELAVMTVIELSVSALTFSRLIRQFFSTNQNSGA